MFTPGDSKFQNKNRMQKEKLERDMKKAIELLFDDEFDFENPNLTIADIRRAYIII